MKLSMKVAAMFLCLLLAAAFARAQQEQLKPANATPANIPHLRVDILLTEYAGDKKVNSLPYALHVGASDFVHGLHADEANLRMGVRVPFAAGPLTGPSTQYEYQNIGTNIDVQAFEIDAGTYRLQCNVERTAVSSPDQEANLQQGRNLASLPVLSNFSSKFELSLHDGESGEGLSATDPFNGHMMKIEVTIHVVK